MSSLENNLMVLICDDSVLIRKKVRANLEKCKCENILEAENGEVAVKLTKEHHPDLVLMDIVMPDKDGIEALKEIKEYDDQIKVVMASSVGTQAHLKTALEHGAFDFIQKPITLEAITNIIEKVLVEKKGGNVGV
ncbi:response regulator [Cytobacillus spongiae]|jgi:two-component system chemotaxis response regulator CheY|uniref:response regulator n=1 Tax=Cytobacillus spongiae TaxID=2901381 RepID=UPI001F46C944|nr:response regulator [Cytobacillus spongiae]UII56818.1 response regulator [Cytobacillus spongiae]